MSTYLECTTGGASKFWEIEVDDARTTIKFGKIGAAGVTQIKDHADEEEAADFADKQITSKVKKGYVLKVGGGGGGGGGAAAGGAKAKAKAGAKAKAAPKAKATAKAKAKGKGAAAPSKAKGGKAKAAAAAPAAATATKRGRAAAAPKAASKRAKPAGGAGAGASAGTSAGGAITASSAADLVDVASGMKGRNDARVLVDGGAEDSDDDDDDDDDEDPTVWDCTLTLIDIAKNSDKFYNLQVIECEEPVTAPAKGKAKAKGAAKTQSVWYCFKRWGRSGTSGQCMLEGPFTDRDGATGEFEVTFESKTGQPWPGGDAFAAFVPKSGKYKMNYKDYSGVAVSKRGKGVWQYYMHAPQDGKAIGWYDYDPAASEIVDDVWQQWQDNPGGGLDVRCVQSGHWMYRVDFNTMTQTNVQHPAHTQRKIRRDAR